MSRRGVDNQPKNRPISYELTHVKSNCKKTRHKEIGLITTCVMSRVSHAQLADEKNQKPQPAVVSCCVIVLRIHPQRGL